MILQLISYFSRFLLVCHFSALRGREAIVGQRILHIICLLAIGMGLATFLHLECIDIFLFCMGKEEKFRFNLENFYQPSSGGIGIKLDFMNPFRLCVNISFFSFAFVVPVFYYKIFKFRKAQDTCIQGT